MAFGPFCLINWWLVQNRGRVSRRQGGQHAGKYRWTETWKLRERKCAGKKYNKWHNKSIFKTVINILAISNHVSLRVLFDKLPPYEVEVASPGKQCIQLYRHTFVPYASGLIYWMEAGRHNKTTMRVIAASPSAKVRKYQNTTLVTSDTWAARWWDRSTIVSCDFLLVLYSNRRSSWNRCRVICC